MHVFLFGATGSTGQLVLQKLLEQGHTVSALARTPESLSEVTSPAFTVYAGDVFRSATFAPYLTGVDVVVSVLGTGKSLAKTTVYSEGGRQIMAAMRQGGVRKLIVVTSGGVQEDDPTILSSWFYRFIGRRLLRNIYDDMRRLEQVLEASPDLDWICVRPTTLVNSPAKGTYRVGLTYSPKGGTKIARADLADFIVQQVIANRYLHQKPVLAY